MYYVKYQAFKSLCVSVIKERKKHLFTKGTCTM